MRVIKEFGMREFKYGVGVIATHFSLNLLLVKMSEKSLTKADFWSKNQKDMSDNGTYVLNRKLTKSCQYIYPFMMSLKQRICNAQGS